MKEITEKELRLIKNLIYRTHKSIYFALNELKIEGVEEIQDKEIECIKKDLLYEEKLDRCDLCGIWENEKDLDYFPPNGPLCNNCILDEE